MKPWIQAKIKQIFEQAGVVYREPEMARVETVVTGQTGRFRGIYYIWPEQNFYVGLAKSPGASIADKRMDTHVLKLTVNLKGLYGGKSEIPKSRRNPTNSSQMVGVGQWQNIC